LAEAEIAEKTEYTWPLTQVAITPGLFDVALLILGDPILKMMFKISMLLLASLTLSASTNTLPEIVEIYLPPLPMKMKIFQALLPIMKKKKKNQASLPIMKKKKNQVPLLPIITKNLRFHRLEIPRRRKLHVQLTAGKRTSSPT